MILHAEPLGARSPAVLRGLHRRMSLRIEILFSLALLATASIMFAVMVVFWFDDYGTREHAAPVITTLVLADVLVFVLFGAVKLRQLVLRPLDEVVATTAAIAAGDLSRRVPVDGSLEFSRLATSVNRMTTRLLEEQALLARLEKIASVGRLAAGVAHEIGNPLGGITGYAQLLRARVASDSESEDAVRGIERESARIDRIVRGMLEYARPRRRAISSVDVNACIRSAVELLRAQGALRDVKLSLDLDARAPFLAGDAHEVEQIFVNLILNAADALDGAGDVSIVSQRVPFAALGREGVRRSVDPAVVTVAREQNPRLRAWVNTAGEPDEVLRIVVADSGPGVPLSESERIFDPFYTTKEPGKGTGLGLAIVARVVESMGGAVWVRPAREGGAAFVMIFAAGPSAAAAVPLQQVATG
ncbi:MAG: sensor histidine kinase [Gemmatimonadaceae bacterium]